MKKRGFLIPLAALASVFTAADASADIPSYADPLIDEKNTLQVGAEDTRITVQGGEDLFDFLLERGEQGQLMAYHSSHSSHSSHGSHGSHASHSSHYSGSY